MRIIYLRCSYVDYNINHIHITKINHDEKNNNNNEKNKHDEENNHHNEKDDPNERSCFDA